MSINSYKLSESQEYHYSSVNEEENQSNETRDEEPIIRQHCFKPKYRPRYFSSKGASLVLIWTLLVSMAFGSLDNLFIGFLTVFSDGSNSFFYIAWLPYLPWFVFALLSGWLADVLFGTHMMVRYGTVILFVATLLQTILMLTQTSASISGNIYVVLNTVIKCFSYASRAIILGTSLQLGLNQMPDASAANITSFISWFVACLYAGNWFFSFIRRIALDCLSSEDGNESLTYNQFIQLLSVSSLGIVLCLDFILSPKYIIKELKLPKSSKTIFKVLEFATKHKAPINRSALTYWEEDIPSRIDLGKSRYGGPFTTEQVEDVKTISRILALGVPLFMIFTSFYLFQQFIYVKDYSATILSNSNCSTILVRSFTYETSGCVVGGIILYEIAIYPIFIPLIPTILKRIGGTSLLIVVLNVISLLVSAIDYTIELTDPTDSDWFWIVHSLLSGPLKIFLLTCVFEFICAQSPHNMKGLMIGYMWSEYYLSNIIANLIAGMVHTLCHNKNLCTIFYSSAQTGLSIAGFILYCVLARWYKRRVRDDIFSPHRWAEDYYSRYLT